MGDLLFDAVEREQLCDLLDELGPDAPTLLHPWTTRDLVAHLVVRERDLVAAPGLVIPGSWARHAERQRKELLSSSPFAELVRVTRAGPPPGFFRIGWVRRLANLNEFFVHHEDVRRANGRGVRSLGAPEHIALFRNVARSAWFLSRRLRGVRLELSWPEGDRVSSARRGGATCRLQGPPGELLLYLFGRGAVAEVEFSGSAGAIALVQRTHFGM